MLNKAALGFGQAGETTQGPSRAIPSSFSEPFVNQLGGEIVWE